MNQATKANRAQVDQHIQRQQSLGEKMIGDNDRPRAWELIASAVVIAAAICGMWILN